MITKTVVFLHGFPNFVKEKSSVYKYFASRNYKIIIPPILTPEVDLNIDSVKNFVRKQLDGQSPDVVVGISMGGLLAPHVAADYPNSRLLLVATGPYLRTKNRMYNFAVKLEKQDKLLLLIRLGKMLPKGLFRIIYRIYNKTHDKSVSTDELERRADEDLDAFSSIHISKLREVLDFAVDINNSKLLQKLNNQTLIIAGKNDSMMPLELSEELRRLIKNSKLVVSDGLHYDVGAHLDEKTLDIFLKKIGR